MHIDIFVLLSPVEMSTPDQSAQEILNDIEKKLGSEMAQNLEGPGGVSVVIY